MSEITLSEKEMRSLTLHGFCCLMMDKVNWPDNKVNVEIILKREDDKFLCKSVAVQLHEDSVVKNLVMFQLIEPID